MVRQLEVIGEASGNVSPRPRSEHPEVPWKGMRGFASFAKHGYWRLEPRRLWSAVVECESTGTLAAKIPVD
jgi:uncharacterized protein with HEPN domain